MDIQEIMQKLDQLYASGTRFEIEEYMIRQRQQAIMTGDWSARLMLQNEMIGLYRTLGEFDKGMGILQETIQNFDQLGLRGTLPFSGTLLNGASLLRAAGRLSEAREMFAQVQEIYESQLEADDYRLAGFYNNAGLLDLDMKNYDQARDYLTRALGIVEKLPDSTVEQATSHTTLANVCMSLKDMTGAWDHLEAGRKLFAKASNQDPHYASWLSALAQYQILTEDWEKAAETYNATLNEIERYHGKNRAYEITRQNLAYVMKKLDKADQAN